MIELAARIARDIDNNAGSANLAKELRELLAELKKQKPWANNALAHRQERARQRKWAQMEEGEWEWSEALNDWIRVDEEEEAS